MRNERGKASIELQNRTWEAKAEEGKERASAAAPLDIIGDNTILTGVLTPSFNFQRFQILANGAVKVFVLVKRYPDLLPLSLKLLGF